MVQSKEGQAFALQEDGSKVIINQSLGRFMCTLRHEGMERCLVGSSFEAHGEAGPLPLLVHLRWCCPVGAACGV
jgi:hypothetical protein